MFSPEQPLINTVLGYLDPGSGGILLYVLAGILVTIVFSVKRLFYTISRKLFFWGHRSDFSGSLRASVILHCEAPRYESLFLPVARALAEKNVDFLLVTQYVRDKSAERLPESYRHVELSMKLGDFEILNHAEADFFLTTTPQLDVLMLKRSKKVKQYGHVWHSATDGGTYEIYALDYFDVCFCPGEYAFDGVRSIEKKRLLPGKTLVSTGVVYYDTMLQLARETKPKSKRGKPRVLIAPSWGPESLFAKQGVDFLDQLVEKYDVTVRPHPQISLSQSQLYDEITSKCAALRIPIDLNPSAIESIRDCDTMVSDFSGITFDFAYLFEKSLVVFDMKTDYRGFEGYWMEKPLWQLRIMRELAEVLPHDGIRELPTAIDRALKRPGNEIAQIRDRYTPNFGQAAPVLVDQMLQAISATATQGRTLNAV